jgi:hypothetical protein
LPLDPNARVPNIRRQVYKDIERSLLNEDGEPGTFHLKHKGITVVARSLREMSDKQRYVVILEEGDGILDGGHTYKLLTKHASDDLLPENQFVKFEILTNVPAEWISDIAGGLNTSVQVQAMSLDNLAQRFDWIKEILAGEPYLDNIAWRENEPGEVNARDIIALLTMFDIEHFPNEGEEQPVEAYKDKAAVLKQFEDRPASYQRLAPILKDVLILHDTIRRDSRKFWNEAGGRFGHFAFVEQKKKGEFTFPFTAQAGPSRLVNGALYPMLGAFRWMVEDDPETGKVRWRGGFAEVMRRWEGSATELVKATAQANTELGRNPNAIGKSKNHWANLHARVAMRDLIDRAGGAGNQGSPDGKLKAGTVSTPDPTS